MYGTAPKRLPHLLPWTWLFHLRRWGELRHTAEQGFRKTSTFYACRVGWNSQHAKFHKALDRCTMVHSTTIQKKSSTSWRVKITSFLFLKKKNCWNFLASWLRFRGFLPCFNCLWEMRFSPWPGSSRQCDVKTEGCQEPRRWAVSL